MKLETFIFGILICFGLSFVMGLERQYRRRFIGLRTTILLAVGTYLFVSMSFIIGADKTDLTRIASGIVSGISFIGAGVIIKQGNKVQGLTTAATLWCDAAIGALCAVGSYLEATIGTIIVIIVNLLLRKVSHSVNLDTRHSLARESYALTVTTDNDKVNNVRKEINELLNNKKYNINIEDIKINKNKDKVEMEIDFMIRIMQNSYVEEVIDTLNLNKDILKIDIRKTYDYLDVEGEF